MIISGVMGANLGGHNVTDDMLPKPDNPWEEL